MSVVYQADVYTQEDECIDTLEVGGDDGSLPEIDMGPDTARQELEQLAQDEYGSEVYISAVRVKGATG
jgi:hypothetical protein